MTAADELDLVLILPGEDECATFDALLSGRQASLGIRSVRDEIHKHPRRDSGVYNEAVDMLRPFQRRARHALVVFDHEGSGQEDRAASEVESDLRERLAGSGWADRVEVLLIQPELEIWVWSDSPQVEAALGWAGRTPTLRSWLHEHGKWDRDLKKPPRPRECLLAALYEVRTRYSSAVFRQLAMTVSLERCQDRSFHRVKQLLRRWFADGNTPDNATSV
jgi:hypothetical protein